jgi:pSer/pThr/pTyr-binding forkhead associated (FHA) protein
MSRQPSDSVGESGGSDQDPADLDARLDRAVPSIGSEAFLLRLGGAHGGRVYPIRHNTILIGRSKDADIMLLDPSVSARHAQLINGSQRFEIEDLGSTNGTTVEGQRIKRAALHSGDRISVGQVEFKFLLDRRVDATLTVLPSGEQWRGEVIRYEPPTGAVGRQTRATPAAKDEDEGPSLEEIMIRVAAGYRSLRRNARLLVGLAAIGAVVGLGSVAILPPPREAACMLKLNPRVKANPVDPQAHERDEDQEVHFFDAAESIFVQPELVGDTLKKLLGHPLPAKTVESIADRLKLEAQPDNIYKASYREKVIGGIPLDPTAFLKAHLDNYLHTEIAHAIQVFTAQAEFLRNQLKAAQADMNKISEQKMEFSQNNSDRLPDTASDTLSSRLELEQRRSTLTAQIRDLQGQLDAARRALIAEGPVAQSKYHESEVYRQSLAEVSRKLEAAYAHGLADGHPEVRALKEEKKRLEGLIDQEMASRTNPLDRESNAGYQELRNRVSLLQAQLSAARGDLADTEKDLRKVETVIEDLPRVQAGVQKLSHMQQATAALHGQLFEQLKKAELQLNLERVSEESRYEIIMPPRLVNSGHLKTAAIRLTVGGVLGLLAALASIVFRKVRRMFGQALANLEASTSPGAR